MVTRITNLIRNNPKEITIHVVLFTLFLWFMEAGMGSSIDEKSKNLIRINFLALPIIFYTNAFFLIPTFLSKKKWGSYIGMMVLIIIIIEISRSLFQIITLADSQDPGQLTFFEILFGKNSVSGGIFLGFLLSFAYTFTKDWLFNLTFIERIKLEQSEMKLAYLKTQIDPHFLFNTLNNLYALALKEDSPKTAAAITKLGTLMRYTLEDTESNEVPLSKELEFIQKYIELQSLRLSEKNDIHFTNLISTLNAEKFQISPLLLITPIENAFKYGINPSKESRIFISIDLKDNMLSLKVKNTVVRTTTTSTTGIGLQNLQDRLLLIYPNRHHFKSNKQENEFEIQLDLELTE